jgi:putative nucleotidyltransferase with HDIG domain
MKNYSELNLEQRFALLSFLVIAGLGVFLAVGNYWFARSQLLNATGGYAEIWINSMARYHLQDNDFIQPLSQSRIDELNRIIKNNILGSDVKRIKIWNHSGRIIYSDEPSIINKSFSIGDDLKKALDGKVAAEFVPPVEDEQKTESQLGPRFLEVYVPILSNKNNEVIGVFELYISDRVLVDKIRSNRLITMLIIIAGLTLLYISLLGVFRKASHTINSQSKEIDKLNSHLDDALSWQEKSYVGIIKALLKALDAKDSYTAGHSTRVTDYAVKIGRALDLTPERLKTLEEAALFHDIGKIGIPEHVMNKPDKFSEAERIVMQSHSTIGYDIINSIHYFEEHAKIIRHHHEWYDGTGYPDGLRGESIPLESRILAVADTYDALVTTRSYKKGLAAKAAQEIIRSEKSTHLDPVIVDVFLNSFL